MKRLVSETTDILQELSPSPAVYVRWLAFGLTSSFSKLTFSQKDVLGPVSRKPRNFSGLQSHS